MSDALLERLRALLCGLGVAVRDRVIAARAEDLDDELTCVVEEEQADTIFGVDRVGEHELLGWFERHWPTDLPVDLVYEGASSTTFPAEGARPPVATVIIDPIDGTRGLMYDKRAAWVLAAVTRRSPACGSARLADLHVAAMTEIPTTSQWRSRQISGLRGRGRAGLIAVDTDVRTGQRAPARLRPSPLATLLHGYGSVCRFFPEGKATLASLEEAFLTKAFGGPLDDHPVVFEDQYASTGGQVAELLAGHDRFVADLRPLVFRHLGLERALCCHPYDACTTWLLEEAGGVVEQPDGRPLDAPLDTVSPVAWVGYANPALARDLRPHLQAAIAEVLGG